MGARSAVANASSPTMRGGRVGSTRPDPIGLISLLEVVDLYFDYRFTIQSLRGSHGTVRNDSYPIENT